MIDLLPFSLILSLFIIISLEEYFGNSRMEEENGNNNGIARKLGKWKAAAAQQVKEMNIGGSRNPPPPKVVCIGAAVVDFEVLPTAIAQNGAIPTKSQTGCYLPAKIVQRPGGVGRNHADALTRLGCDVRFLTVLGADQQGRPDLGAMFLTQQSGAHINWSDAQHSAGQTTACSIGNISSGFISVDHLMAELTPDYIDEKFDVISDANFVLMDANLSVPAIRMVQRRAEMCGIKIWFEPSNAMKVPKLFAALGTNALQKMNVVSPNLMEMHAFASEQLLVSKEGAEWAQYFDRIQSHLRSRENPITVASLPPPPTRSLCPKDHLLITLDRHGVMLISNNDESTSSDGKSTVKFVTPPRIEAHEIVSVSGAGDCFNSGFLCGLMNAFNVETCLELAKECAMESLRSEQAIPETINKEMVRKFM